MEKKYLFWNILRNSFAFYAKNFNKLFKVMFLPIFFQIIGIFLCLFPVFYLTSTNKLTADTIYSYLLPILICLVVGLIIYCAAFWKYLLLNCSFVYAANDYDESRDLYMNIYDSKVLKIQSKYIKVLLWPALYIFLFILAGIALLAFSFSLNKIPAFLMGTLALVVLIVAPIIISLKISLLAQIFVLEPDLKPLEVMKKSFAMVRGSAFFKVAGMLLILSVFSLLLQFVIAIFVGIPLIVFVGGDIASKLSDLISSLILMFLLPLYVSSMTFMYKSLITK